jgi:hypothetical protein
MNTELLFLPSEIPWGSLKGKDLEEGLYWLFDAMGAREMEWRLGGTGDGTSDGGRDLEVLFSFPSPDAEMITQRWWIEAKGRNKTVEKVAVTNSVLNAAGNQGVDVLVIATNTNFSNPTSDWVKQWQANHPWPKVRLWDRYHLERLFSKHPEAVVRLFPSLLTIQGKLEVVKSRFWNFSAYASKIVLDQLWKSRQAIEWNDEAIVSVLASEMANGDILQRPWHATISDKRQLKVLVVALLNILPFCIRADKAGGEQTPYFKAIGLLISLSLIRSGADKTVRFISEAWDTADGITFPEELRRIVIKPILDQMAREYRDACTSDCRRVVTDPIEMTESEITSYWKRFLVSPNEEPNQDEDRRVLTIESYKTPCKVGFRAVGKRCCPLMEFEERDTFPAIDEMLSSFARILSHRVSLEKKNT